jgi:hypothetical protein
VRGRSTRAVGVTELCQVPTERAGVERTVHAQRTPEGAAALRQSEAGQVTMH